MKFIGEVVGLCLLLHVLTISTRAEEYTDCGGTLDHERGYIQSPNFPGQFPTPVSCRWVIHAPPERKIIIYFTQYFLREGFHLSEYDHYTNEVSYAGKKNLGEINFEDEFTSFVAYKSYVVIHLHVRDHGNIHLRVEEYLLNVYGFNITYEIVGLDTAVRQNTCSVHQCSFLGNCVASYNYTDYRCDCFNGFHGNECQYGPSCDPDNGTNTCENGGKCRYIYGSRINTCECPPDFKGSKCQLKIDRPLNQDCEKLGCSQLCKQSSDEKYYCSCEEGYGLDGDNVTCLEKAMYRVTVEAPVKKGVIIPRGFTSKSIDVTSVLKPRVRSTMLLSGITSFSAFKFDGIRSRSGQTVIVFHFYIETKDQHLVDRGLRFLTIGHKLFGVDVNTSAIVYQVDPEMKLLAVEDYGERPAVQGKLLTLMCTARGSEQMKFQWLKDGSLLNTSLSQRNTWEIRIPKTIKNKQISVLNIDGVEFYDKGEFTCRIEDFNESENASVSVDVITVPVLDMTPLTMSVKKGDTTNFRCLSPDDTIEKRSFRYDWLKNGKPIPSDSKHEVVEDVFPRGRRVRIRNAQYDANYTCTITNPAGSTNKTAYLFVKEEEDILGYCPENVYEGVTWARTFGDCFDVQRCPTDTGDVRVLKARGYSRRWCRCTEKSCNWTKPNFVKCQSGHLIMIFDRLEKIKLGYQHEEVLSIWEDLYGLIRQARGKLYAGDVDVSASILHTLVKTLVQYPSLAPNNGSFSLKSLLDFTNTLMEEALLTTDEEKESIYVGPKVMQISEMTGSLHLKNFQFHEGLTIANDKIVAKVEKMKLISPNATVPTLPDQTYSVGESPDLQPRSVRHKREEIKISKGSSFFSAPQDTLEPMFIYQYVDLYSLLHDTYAEQIISPDFITDVHSVFPLDTFFLMKNLKVEVQLHHPNHVILKGSNVTTCVSWRTIDSDVLNGHWSFRDCDVVKRNMTSTTCWCDVPGHFAVIVKQINVTIPVVPETYEEVLLTGCVISMCGLLATLVIYLFTWRHLVGDAHCIHMNFVISLAIVNAICITCLGKSQVQTLCAAGKILLQFFYLAAFAFMFVEAVHMFVVVHTRHRVSKSFLKYFLIGWGIPTLASGSVVIASEKYGYDDSCIEWCWLSDSHWHFYSFLVPVVVLVMAQITLCGISVVTVRGWKDEWRFKDRRKHLLNAGKICILQFLLTLTCVSGTLLEQKANNVFLYVFLLVDIIMGVTIFLFFVVFKRQVRLSLKYVFKRSRNNTDMKRKLSSRSFKAYMMPEKIDERGETIEESIHRHQSQINQKKFTRERKKQLEHLLGSSSSASSTSASGSGSDNSQDSHIRFLTSPLTPVDSGILEGDESENCSMKNTTGIHYICSVRKIGDGSEDDTGEESPGASPQDKFLPGPITDLPIVTVHAS